MKNVLDKTVSLFKNAHSPDKPKDINLFSYLTTPNQGYIPLVEAIRGEPDVQKRKQLKRKIPAITPSGTFRKRGTHGLIDHSWLICIDIDFEDNKHIQNYADLKDQLKNINVVAYCGLSVSGTGYMLLIPINTPIKHKEHFFALEKKFAAIGIIVDTQCKNVDRLRFYSYDAEAYINPSADVFKGLNYPERELVRKKAFTRTFNNYETRLEVERCIQQINKLEIDITGGYHDWLRICFALANEFRDNGREYFHAVSQHSPKYTIEDTDRQFTKCLKADNGGIKIGTFFKYCQDFNITPKR